MKHRESEKPALTFSALKLWRTAGRHVRLEIRGTSMRPFIEPGDDITIRLVMPERLRIGDFMAFWDENRVVVHRLVKKRRSEKGSSFCEKADNLPGWEWIDEDLVLGKVVSVHGRKGRMKLEAWPWRWINPAVGRVLCTWISFCEKCRTRRPPDRGRQPGLSSRIVSCFLKVFNWTYQAAMGLVLCFIRFLGIGRSERI